MREIIVGELTQAAEEIFRGFARLLPRLIVMLVIVFVGWLIAYILRAILRSILQFAKFDRLFERAGASQMLTQAALPSPTELVSRFSFWLAWIGFIMLGVDVLGIGGLQAHVTRFFEFVPRLVVASLIVFFGLLLASFLSRAALLAAVNANLPSPRVVSFSIRLLISIFVLSMVFEELGVGDQTMLLAFGILFGAVMFGLAIAFGIGGKELAQRFLEDRLVRGRKNVREDEPSPL
jgi:Conserved TM helix